LTLHARPSRHPGPAASAWILALAVLLPAAPVTAHSPHDVINVLGITSDPSGNQIVFAMMRLTGREMLGRSMDGGDSWTITALPTLPRDVSRISFSPEFALDGTAFLSTTDVGILKTVDGGSSWTLLTGAGLDPRVLDLGLSPSYPQDQTLLAATATSVLRSTDGGLTWSPSATGMIETIVTRLVYASDDPLVVFAGQQILHRSDDGGLNWTPLFSFENRLNSLSVSPSFSTDGGLVVALENAGGVFASVDGGNAWAPMAVGLTDPNVNSVALGSDGMVFAVSESAALFRGPLGGSFSQVGTGFEDLSDQTTDHFRGVALSPGYPNDGIVWVGSFEGLYVSEDQGESFRQLDIYHQKFARSLAFSPDYTSTGRLYLQTYGGGLLTSPVYPTLTPPGGSDSLGGAATSGSSSPTAPGRTQSAAPAGAPMKQAPLDPVAAWESRSESITALFGQRLVLSPDHISDNTLYYAQVGLWRSTDRAQSWQKQPVPPGVTVIRALSLSPDYSIDTTLFLGAGQAAGAFKSVDAGASWSPMTQGLPVGILPAEILFAPDYASTQDAFLADRLAGVFLSLDGGDSWSASNAGLDELNLHSMAMSPDFLADQILMVGTESLGLYRSTDAGASWSASNTGLPSRIPLNVESIAFSPDFAADATLFIAVLAAGVYRSTDAGLSWQTVGTGLPEDAPRVVALSPDFGSDQTLLVSTYSWVYRSQDGGASFARLPGYARVDDGNPALAYHVANDLDAASTSAGSNWSVNAWILAGKPSALALAVRTSADAGDAVEYHFVGNSIRWYAARGPDHGMAQVLLDGIPIQLIDLYAPVASATEVVFSQAFGSVETHTIRVENAGLANPLASDILVRTDGFDVTY
jgi:photosystem II stability/assembly factor-like uncharacterized protein